MNGRFPQQLAKRGKIISVVVRPPHFVGSVSRFQGIFGLWRLMSDSAQKTSGQHDLDQDEWLALAAADAIKRIIAERNALRDQSAAQGQELLRLNQYVTLIRDSYRKLTYEFVTQLQNLDQTVSEVLPRSAATGGLTAASNEKQDRTVD